MEVGRGRDFLSPAPQLNYLLHKASRNAAIFIKITASFHGCVMHRSQCIFYKRNPHPRLSPLNSHWESEARKRKGKREDSRMAYIMGSWTTARNRTSFPTPSHESYPPDQQKQVIVTIDAAATHASPHRCTLRPHTKPQNESVHSYSC